MAKITNPYTFSTSFGIKPAVLGKLGVFDPLLSADTLLFIDPLLFPKSEQAEFREGAVQSYKAYFEVLIKLLRNVKNCDASDVAYRAADRLINIHEPVGTCLGYGAGSIHGSAWGPMLRARMLKVGKQIVDLGIADPDLFQLLALFEDDIGPDRIGDMAAHVVQENIAAFNKRILATLGLKLEKFDQPGAHGEFVVNPHQPERTPVILLPTDILRRLPVATDWDSIADAAAQNEAIRESVNKHVGHIWAAKSKRDAAKLKDEALASAEAFNALLAAMHAIRPAAYEVTKDPEGLRRWVTEAIDAAAQNPLDLARFKDGPPSLETAERIVTNIVDMFAFLVGKRGLWRSLYKESGNPCHESASQRLFFAVAHSYCEANKLDLSPEVDTGSGKIDFKFSKGSDAKILVEIKLSRNSKVIEGFEKQLEAYKDAEKTSRAFYVVLDVGQMGKKDRALLEMRNSRTTKGEPASTLVFIDARPKESASKL